MESEMAEACDERENGARMEELEEEEEELQQQGSSLTMEKVAAAKRFIENHYKDQRKNLQERKERSSPAPI